MTPPLKLLLVREKTRHLTKGEPYTPGKLYVNNVYFCETCEDQDRFLETVGVEGKVYGRTAIPRGTYKVEVSLSSRFKRLLPAVLNVMGFSGIRFHGGNRAEDSLGCILCGKIRTATGIAQCKDTVLSLIKSIQDNGNQATLEIR